MRFTDAVEEAGVTYRQADWWRRCGYIDCFTEGSGSISDLGAREALVLRRMGVLVNAGVKPSAAAVIARTTVVQNVRAADLPGGLRIVFDVVKT